MNKINILSTAVFVLLIGIAGTAQATTYYVRTDGGTNTQCTGLADAPYPGTGTNAACAFNHPFWAVSVAGAPMAMVGGDTLIIGPGQYQMGLNAPNTPVCSQFYPWDCFMRAIPSGTATNPTRILGKGYNTGCTSKPQLWGNERSSSVLNLQGSSNVEIQCLEITDHSSCLLFGPDPASICNRDTYPYGPWAVNGIVASDSQNVLLNNVSVHGLYNGVLAGRLTNWTIQNVDIIANSSAGWNGDIGTGVSSNSGTIAFKNTRIMWNGCGETYPGLQPYLCYSQDQGGYGDGLGTQVTGGDWVFDHVDFSHNVSDGLDLLYHDKTGSITVTHSRFEGNSGNQVKVATNTIIDNSKMIGDCAYFNGKPFTSTVGLGGVPVAYNNCRAMGNTIAVAAYGGMTVQIYNSTITGNGDVLIQSAGTGCLSTDKIVSKNNIYIGGPEFNTAGADISDLYYASGQTGNGDGTCGTLPLATSNDIIWATKYNSSECTGNTSKCVDPKIVGPLSYTGDDQNVSLQTGSPAINAGIVMSTLGNTDFNNFDRGAQWDIGALQHGSVPTGVTSTSTPPPTTPPPAPATIPIAVCGNGVVETGEQCDGAALNGQTCVSQGFTGGTLGCTSSCQLNTSACTKTTTTSTCGNGILEPGEQCEKGTLNGYSCTLLGYSGGSLGCSSACQFNTNACKGPLTTPVKITPACGNKILEPGEQCEIGTLNGASCKSLGFTGGGLGCSSSCQFNTNGCTKSVCGNGIIETGEQCDGTNLNSQTCVSKGFAGGTLACSSSCVFDTSGCSSTLCGNGVIDTGEQCDGTNLNSQTCVSRGFAGGGTLACSSCTFDTSACKASLCGNGIIETGEQCDGTNLNGQTCVSKGFIGGGTLSCMNCAFNTSACKAGLCGNGVVDPGEQCDGTNLNGQTCIGKGFAGGSLACTSSCTLDTSACKANLCGNGIIDAGEQCDGTNLNGQTCVSKGFAGGSLVCSSSCTLDTSACKASLCGNGIIEAGEQCDGSNLNAQTCASQGFAGGELSCSSSCAFDTSGCLTTFCGNGIIEAGEQCDGSNFNGLTCANYGFNSGALACSSSCAIVTSGCRTIRNKNSIF